MVQRSKLLIMPMLCSIVFVTMVQAEVVCVSIRAQVDTVNDFDGYVGGAINVGDVITGTYVYESTTADSDPFPTVGTYDHVAAPFGITLNVNGHVFRTDPDDVNFLVQVSDNHGDPVGDTYLLRSFNNIFDIAVPMDASALPLSENHISWQLDDPTTTALASDALPAVPPTLDDWESNLGLIIYSYNGDTFESIFIGAHVTSAHLCSADPCDDGGTESVAVCHKPGHKAQKTLFLSPEEVQAHLNHGDVLGECP